MTHSGHRGSRAGQCPMGRSMFLLPPHRCFGFNGLGLIVPQRFKVHIADKRDGLVVHLLKRPAAGVEVLEGLFELGPHVARADDVA
jgi:hypothetical protein